LSYWLEASYVVWQISSRSSLLSFNDQHRKNNPGAQLQNFPQVCGEVKNLCHGRIPQERKKKKKKQEKKKKKNEE